MYRDIVIKVGADPFPPYQYYAEDGTLRGVDYDMVKKSFDYLGLRSEYIIKEWSEIQQMLERRELDVAFQVQPTPERLRRFQFSRLLRNAETQVLCTDKSLGINSYHDIADRELSLGIVEGYTNCYEIDHLPPNLKHVYASADTLLRAITDQEVDVGVFDKGVKEFLVEKHGIEGLYVIEPLTFIRPLHVIFHSAALKDMFDRALEKIQKPPFCYI